MEKMKNMAVYGSGQMMMKVGADGIVSQVESRPETMIVSRLGNKDPKRQQAAALHGHCMPNSSGTPGRTHGSWRPGVAVLQSLFRNRVSEGEA